MIRLFLGATALALIAANSLAAEPISYTGPVLQDDGRTVNAKVLVTPNTGLPVTPYAQGASLVSGVTVAPMTGTASTALVAAPGAGLRNYVTHISCINAHASVDTLVNVQDGSGGTVIYQLGAVHGYGGESITLPAPLRQPSANTGLYVADATTGASVTCAASGFKAP